MSASSPDRVKDTIDPKAYDSINTKKLIALWQHDANQPIGYWENLRKDGTRLLGDLKVASTNLGLMIKQLIADDVPLSASIGFRGTGDRNKAGGIHFKTLELLECSVVSIPAHPSAVMLAKQFNLESLIEQSSLEEETADSGKDPQAVIKKSKAAILSAVKTLRK